jgi:hypothetical protein
MSEPEVSLNVVSLVKFRWEKELSKKFTERDLWDYIDLETAHLQEGLGYELVSEESFWFEKDARAEFRVEQTYEYPPEHFSED